LRSFAASSRTAKPLIDAYVQGEQKRDEQRWKRTSAQVLDDPKPQIAPDYKFPDGWPYGIPAPIIP